MSRSNMTDERLRFWLDTNQLSRERLCLGILSVDRRFFNARPRHPRGGPDGGIDIQAECKEGSVLGAIGFLNSVSDSNKNKNDINKKFTYDLGQAIKFDPELKAFIFFCNVNLTVGEKQKLYLTAKSKGILICDIYDRERIRIVLDSADGFALRFQYLSMGLTKPEQATFFAKWGGDIQATISNSIESIDSKT